MVTTAAEAISHLLAGDVQYVPNYLYVAFKNVATAGEHVAEDTSISTDVLGFYNGLTDNCDYLKIPIDIKPEVIVDEDVANYAVKYTVLVSSNDTTGVHGLPFSSDANSTVYANSLVALADTTNPDSAIAITYGHLPDNQQLIAPANTTLGFTIVVNVNF